MTLHTIYRDPFVLGSPIVQEWAPGLTLAEMAERAPGLPMDFGARGCIAVNGETVPIEWWARVRPKANAVVTFHVQLAGGGGGGGKAVFGLVAAIALTLATGGIASGALAPLLGASFAAGTLGATLLAAGVGIVGALAISALTSPPTTEVAEEKSSAAGRLEPASVEGNILEPNTPIPRVIGSRRIYPPFACEPVIELVDQDEVVEAVYCLAGPHYLEDFRLGEAGVEESADDAKDVEIETREGLPGELPLELVERQGRSTEPNVELSVHIVDLENPDTLSDETADPLPVWHAVTTRVSPDENWIHFLLAGLIRQDDDDDSLRIPIRIRMRRRGDTDWRYLPEIHYRDVTQSQKRLQVRLFWGDPYEDTLVTAPTTIGFVTAYYYVPAQSVQPVGTAWYADSYFYGGSGATYYNANNPGSTGLQNINLYSDHVDIYLDTDEWEPGIWDIEVKRGEVFRAGVFTESSYAYSGDTLDFFGRIESGDLPLSRGGLLDQLTLVRLVNIWNEYPILQANMALVAIKAKNRSVSRMSCIASGYVNDVVSGQGPYLGAGSFATAWWSWDTPGSFDDGEILVLIRPTTADGTEAADRPESIGVVLRGAAAPDGYVAHFGSGGSGGKDRLVLTKVVAGVVDKIDSAVFPWEVNKNYFIRFSVVGTAISVKAWSASLCEPDDWMIEATDSDITAAGYTGLFLLENLSEGYCNWFSVAFDEDTAASPPELVNAYQNDFSTYTEGDDLDDLSDWTCRYGSANWAVITANINLPYNGEATEWSTVTTTSNPAPHFRDVLIGNQNLDPLPFELLDSLGMVTWRMRCAESGFVCDLVVEGLEIADLLRVVGSTGYARLYRSEIWGVTQDYNRATESPVQVFTPRNSSGFSWRRAFTRLPAGFRINYRDEGIDYGIDQIAVYRAGAEGSGAKLEQTTYDGLVAKGDIIRRASFDLAQAEKRSTFYTFDAPAESLVCRRGSLIGVNYDVLNSHHGYARIKHVVYDEGNVTGLVLDSSIQIWYEEDVLDKFDMLGVEDVLTMGLYSAIAIRRSTGEVTVHGLASSTDTGYSDEITFETPFQNVKIGAAGFDRVGIPEVEPGCLVVSGLSGQEYKRLVVSEIQPSADLTARLICVDEASDIFNEVFGKTYS